VSGIPVSHESCDDAEACLARFHVFFSVLNARRSHTCTNIACKVLAAAEF